MHLGRSARKSESIPKNSVYKVLIFKKLLEISIVDNLTILSRGHINYSRSMLHYCTMTEIHPKFLPPPIRIVQIVYVSQHHGDKIVRLKDG